MLKKTNIKSNNYNNKIIINKCGKERERKEQKGGRERERAREREREWGREKEDREKERGERANDNIPKRVNRLWGVTIFRGREEQQAA